MMKLNAESETIISNCVYPSKKKVNEEIHLKWEQYSAKYSISMSN